MDDCPHMEWVFRKRTCSNGTLHLMRQCPICGEIQNPSKPLAHGWLEDGQVKDLPEIEPRTTESERSGKFL